MNKITRYEPQTSIELAPAAWQLAEKIASTEFVPTALRGKPEAVLACILTGHEAGISPMQALAKIHIIEGRPAMSAELMRALVLKHGHELDYPSVSNTSVTAEGRRAGSDRWTRVTWTLDDAKRGGLDQKQNWRKWPRAMLLARATAELCRLKFPDVLAGISHTIEELSDGNLSDSIIDYGPPETSDDSPSASPPTRTARAKNGAVTRPNQPADAPAPAPPKPRGSVPDLPEEPRSVTPVVDTSDNTTDDTSAELEPLNVSARQATLGSRAQRTIDATVIDTTAIETDEDLWVSAGWPTSAPKYTGPQLVAMRLAETLGIKGNGTTARDERLAAISAILDRPISSSKDLSPADIALIIEVLDNLPAGSNLESIAGRALGSEPRLSEPEIGHSSPTPPAITTDSADSWTGDQWRHTIGTLKTVKVGEVLTKARAISGDSGTRIVDLDDIASTRIGEQLLGWLQETALERRAR